MSVRINRSSQFVMNRSKSSQKIRVSSNPKQRTDSIEKMENLNKTRVAFIKGRQDLFNKATNLSKLCSGSETGVVAFSPSGRPYPFASGNPSSSSSSSSIDIDFDAVLHRYLRFGGFPITISSPLSFNHPRAASPADIDFTKRLQVVLKKADQLSKLCGCEVGIVSFSPAGIPYLFGVAPGATASNDNPTTTSSPCFDFDSVLHHYISCSRPISSTVVFPSIPTAETVIDAYIEEIQATHQRLAASSSTSNHPTTAASSALVF